ncbi:MAG: M3 family metallopeptidase [Duncaniella sp.]|nr:M3 family metallopeptidase [Duncaniella sp.]HBI59029.1 peptidase M3 [Porphyromonadaceae bacterium]
MTQAQNPFFQDFTATPHGTTPFDKISVTDYEPAIDRGIELGLQEVDAIVKQRSVPDFDNTIVALERSGKDLNRVLNVFYPLLSALSDDEMMGLSMRVTPKLSDYQTSISLNEGLWNRIKQVYDSRSKFNLTPEDSMLLQTTYDSFVRSGALLQGADREKYRKLSARLSELTTLFGQNVLKELNTYEIWLTADDLAGLPESSVEAAALAAKEKGREGEYLFTLAQPTYMAFMKYSSRPDLREKFYRLYNGRNTKGEYSNVEILKEIAATRLELANLMGFETYADYSLEHTMAQTPEKVYELLYQLRDAYRPAQIAEFKELADFASKLEGKPIKINPWDYSYYSNKLKNEKYSYNEEELRPYFELNNVIDGVFGLATKLYGLTFVENKEIPVYHPDVKAFDVNDKDGSYLGVIYTDFFPRDSKRPGAWMTGFKDEFYTADGKSSRPHVSIVMNFTKPTDSKPSLLTPYEVETFLHEFGHALHGLLADTKYASLSGTAVYRDFVELPSQFNENYLTQKAFLDGFARHYETGEPIPQEYVDKIISSSQFGAAYACLRQLNFGLVDMAWHTVTAPVEDAEAFEQKAGESVAMFEPIEGLMLSPQFSHIFSGGYAAGYYSYKWAEVLDADAFAMFLENGIFDQKTADSFRRNVLMKGGTENPAELYRRFRGQDPTIDALLERDGIKSPEKKPAQGNLPMPKDR